jgi:uncharacterized protein with HEPN domain
MCSTPAPTSPNLSHKDAEAAKSKLVLNAVVRQLLVIGEAVKRVSPETKALAPEVPWKQIAGMRDRLVHDYFDIVPDQVWNAGFNDIPKLHLEIQALMDRLDPSCGRPPDRG